MPTLKLHYEGWVSLPAVLRQQLGLNSGDRLEVDLVDGTIVLRPAATTKRPAPRADQEAAIDSPAPAAPETLVLTDAVPARRKPERPRKHEHRRADPEAPARSAKGDARAGAGTSAGAYGQQRALEAAAQGGPAAAGGERAACRAAESPP